MHASVSVAFVHWERTRKLYPSPGAERSSPWTCSRSNWLIGFAAKEETDNPTVAYLLKRLEKEERRTVDGAQAKDLDPGVSLAVEHILPKNPTEDWIKNFPDQDERESAIYRLGNLCLLGEDKLGRKKFELKKPTYKISDLHLTREVSKQDDWTMKSIEWRQAKLAKLAVSAWRFS